APPDPAPSELSDEVRRVALRLERIRPRTDERELLLARGAFASGDHERVFALTEDVARRATADEPEARRIRGLAATRLQDRPRLGRELIAAIEAGPFEMAALQPLVGTLEQDRSVVAQEKLRPFASKGGIGARALASIRDQAVDRERVLRAIKMSPEERGRYPNIELKLDIDACGRLAGSVPQERTLRALLFWERGELGEAFAQRTLSAARALVDLAEGARVLQERSLALLARVDVAAVDTRWEKLDETVEKLANDEEEP